jgi:hypothetical protein
VGQFWIAMDTWHKSEAMLAFEHGLAELEHCFEHGEVGHDEMLVRYNRMLSAAMASVTDSERAHLQRLAMNAHRIGAEILADHGRRVPGNDPQKPN